HGIKASHHGMPVYRARVRSGVSGHPKRRYGCPAAASSRALGRSTVGRVGYQPRLTSSPKCALMAGDQGVAGNGSKPEPSGSLTMAMTVTELAEQVRESNERLTEAIQDLRKESTDFRKEFVDFRKESAGF